MAGDEPDHEATMVAAPRSAARPTPPPVRTSAASTAAATKPTPAPAKKSALPSIVGAVIAVVLLAGGGTYYFLLRPSDSGKTVVVARLKTSDSPAPNSRSEFQELRRLFQRDGSMTSQTKP